MSLDLFTFREIWNKPKPSYFSHDYLKTLVSVEATKPFHKFAVAQIYPSKLNITCM